MFFQHPPLHLTFHAAWWSVPLFITPQQPLSWFNNSYCCVTCYTGLALQSWLGKVKNMTCQGWWARYGRLSQLLTLYWVLPTFLLLDFILKFVGLSAFEDSFALKQISSEELHQQNHWNHNKKSQFASYGPCLLSREEKKFNSTKGRTKQLSGCCSPLLTSLFFFRNKCDGLS